MHMELVTRINFEVETHKHLQVGCARPLLADCPYQRNQFACNFTFHSTCMREHARCGMRAVAPAVHRRLVRSKRVP